MNGHETLDQKSYEMHQVIAHILREDPAGLTVALAWIEKLLSDPEYSIHSKDALTEWRDIIRSGGMDAVLAILEDRSEHGTRLRHASPFASLMPQDKRLEILRRHEARRPRTPSPGL